MGDKQEDNGRPERLRHFASVSLPLFDTDRSFLGAVTVSGLAAEISDANLLDYVAIAKEELTRAGFA
ncbi:hypothetical protein [Agrobacterium tumefaciens]|uniref:hypothetical protein n=1 Tax=Rhizobium/Agrobacterium group TaxID=227290 RepID=UPI001573D4BA|nr:hypothetical protein [Agrobacterium tumefaciens]NTA83754.1 hypothetical protein [Agrobacterium tumefaciens]